MALSAGSTISLNYHAISFRIAASHEFVCLWCFSIPQRGVNYAHWGGQPH